MGRINKDSPMLAVVTGILHGLPTVGALFLRLIETGTLKSI